MSIRAIVIYLPLIILASHLLSCKPVEKEAIVKEDGRPNIVLIMADDLGWADLPCYGNEFNEARHIDLLSKQGMRFTNAYAAAPVCSPTRVSIQSGQYPARLGINDFMIGHWRPYERMTVPINKTQYLPQAITTMPEALQAAGYATGYYGKWHLGGQGSMPSDHGYDDHRVHTRGRFYNLKQHEAISPPDDSIDDQIRVSELLTDYSIDFIEKHKEQPFFLMLSHYDVHVQLDADKDLIDKYLAKPKWDDYPSNAIYAAMIEHLDRSVGRVMDKLKSSGLEENTILIFYSDNGGLIRRFDEIPLIVDDKQGVYKNSDLLYIASSNVPLRAEKGTIYEGGIREPMIVRWPGKIKPNTTSDHVMTSVDFYPTFLELSNTVGDTSHILDGESLLESFTELKENLDRPIYWHYPVYHHSEPAGAMRQGDWKLVENFTDNSLELYNLKNDIGEQQNLTLEYPTKAKEMQQALNQWRTSVNAQLPKINPDFDESKRYEWGRHPDSR